MLALDEETIKGFPQIVEEMPAVGHLQGLRRAESRSLRIGAAAIPTHHLHPGMRLEPRRKRRGLPIRQEIDDQPLFHINQDRAERSPLPN